MIIYKITNTITGRVYIGQTVQTLKERWRQHRQRDNSRNEQSYLHNSITKYGADCFTVEQIDSASTLEGLNVLETHYIKVFDCLSPKGYNLELGGNSKLCHEDTKAKISNTMRGRPILNRWEKGRTGPHLEETKEKIRQKLKGRPIEGRWTGGNTSARSEETKAKLRAALKGKPQPGKHKEVIILETGEVFVSVATAAQASGIHRTQVSELLKSGKRHKKTGLTFAFTSNYKIKVA